MPYREMTITITDGTISRIQSANESVKKQLIAQYCGRLSTWEASWFSVLKEGQIVLEAHEVHGQWLSPAPVFSAYTSVPDNSSSRASGNTPDDISDRNRRRVSAVNKVLERYNLVRKRRLH